jgi:hypothetical protein
MSKELENGIDITPEDSVVPVYLVPPTSEFLRELEEIGVAQEAERQAETARTAAKESAIAKLAKLGLTEEEARAVIGI